MEKVCEFCKALRPVVYCKSDTAHLCLSCDAKVHSANALSYRHPRTLVCETCRFEPAHVRCFDHEMFLCQSCDTSHHVTIQHQKKPVSSYVGCPSAKDLAVLWGFDLNQLENKCIESEEGSSGHRMKVVKNDNRQQNTCSVLQQIQDLERNHQLYEGIDTSCLVHVKERMNGLSFEHDAMRKVQETLDNQMEHFYRHLEFQHVDIPQDETTEETYLSPFSQLDPLESTENSLHGDSFWECKSPDNEIWLQNMQDLGVCDEVKSFDDVNIPEVDLTFRNFEEIFGIEHELSRTPVDDKNIKACSSNEMFSWSGRLDRGCSSIIEHGSCDSDIMRIDGKENVIMRYKEKKILRREKQANMHPKNLNRMARNG